MPRAGKIVNFRLPFAAAISMVCGVALSYAFLRAGISFFWLLALVPAASLAFIVCALVSRRAAACVCCALLIACFAAGAGLCAAVLYELDCPPALPQGLCAIKGVVEEAGFTSSGSPYLILSSVTADGLALGGKVIVYLGEGSGGAVSAGYTVSLSGTVSCYELISYGSLNYNIISGVRYYASSAGAVDYAYGFSLFSYLRSAIYATLFQNLDYETAAVAYAMITGGTQFVSESTLDSFRYGGVSHIFAVSGLNITILYFAVTALLKRLRVNRWINFAVGLAVVFVYTGMCGFTLSAVRAAIMCAVAALASVAMKKYDGLNSLSLSVIIILLLNPLNLFDVGFILSVSAMLGIIFLSPGISRLFKRLPSGLRSNISMSLASQAATMPALLLTFGYISGAGLILNIVVLPLLSLLYIVLFVGAVACTVIPALSVMLPSAALPLEAVINFFVEYGFERSLLSGFGGWWTAVIVFAGIAALSDKFNFSTSFRAAAGGVCALCFALCCVLGGCVFGDEARIVAGGYYGGGMVLVHSRSSTSLIVIEGTYPGGISSFVSTYAPGGVDELIILGGDECASYFYECGAECDIVRLPPSSIDLGALDGAEVSYLKNFQSDGIYYEFIDGYTLSVSCRGITFAVAAGQYAHVGACDLAFILNGSARVPAENEVYFAGEGGDFDLCAQGCLQFIAKGGKLLLTGYMPA